MPEAQKTFPAQYEFRVGERLSLRSATWFEGMTVTVDESQNANRPAQTVIKGAVRDQAALFGIVNRIRDLGLTLISVRRLEEGEGDVDVT